MRLLPNKEFSLSSIWAGEVLLIINHHVSNFKIVSSDGNGLCHDVLVL